MPLSGRKALVIGGSAGIGRGIAAAWAAAGAEVSVCGRTPPRGPGADALSWHALDLTRPSLSLAALSALGATPLDLVCYSAVHYGPRRRPFAATAETEWRDQLAVNVTGLRHTLLACLPSLRAAGGLFLGVSSEVAFNAGPGRSGYAATKAAARSLLDSLAQEEEPAQVRIVQVLPEAMVDTPGIRRRRPPGFDYSSYMRADAFGRVATELATATGPDHHGDTLVVSGDGSWRPIRDGVPHSQSRPLSAR